MRLKYRKSDEEHKVNAVAIRPKDLPKPQNIVEWKFALERNKDPAEAEE